MTSFCPALNILTSTIYGTIPHQEWVEVAKQLLVYKEGHCEHVYCIIMPRARLYQDPHVPDPVAAGTGSEGGGGD